MQVPQPVQNAMWATIKMAYLHLNAHYAQMQFRAAQYALLPQHAYNVNPCIS